MMRLSCSKSQMNVDAPISGALNKPRQQKSIYRAKCLSKSYIYLYILLFVYGSLYDTTYMCVNNPKILLISIRKYYLHVNFIIFINHSFLIIQYSIYIYIYI